MCFILSGGEHLLFPTHPSERLLKGREEARRTHLLDTRSPGWRLPWVPFPRRSERERCASHRDARGFVPLLRIAGKRPSPHVGAIRTLLALDLHHGGQSAEPKYFKTV